MADYVFSAAGLLFLVTATLTLLGQSNAMYWGSNSSLAKTGCSDKCGDVIIPYPFGVADATTDCFLNDSFRVYCHDHAPYFTEDKKFKVLEINLNQGEVRILREIASSCDKTQRKHIWFFVDDGFTVSCNNKFTALGCDILATISGENQHHYNSLCSSYCTQGSIKDNTECTGNGCCEIPILCGLQSVSFSIELMNNSVRSFNPCSYAFVAEAGWFNFSTSYITSTDFGTRYHSVDRGVPMVLDWAVGNENCVEAKRNSSSYACRAINSECIDSTSGLGYRCVCSQGYDGNPYLDGVCHDINECDSPSKYPCNGECINTIGSYNCSCPHGTQSEDPKKSRCTTIPQKNQRLLKLFIGIGVGFTFLVIFIFALVTKCQKRKLAKEKERFFKQNGGQILYQQILSQKVETVTIFTLEDLKTATNNFDKSREVGKGGHGTVYKGTLRDNRPIAVKRSKAMNVSEIEEFVQEIVILSQINHKNVVRLLGCCLEVEVPILVYEFIPNGTLFHLIHASDGRPHMSLEGRLKIAQESAEALEYLHLSTNIPIVHGDVKSPNILLDENYMAKVTDFGASRILPKDADQLITMVQGTMGYLDPEFLQERKITEKSDVYSFGVVLLELITGKKAIYSEGLERGKCLASCFVQAMKENRVEGMLDASIICVGMEELLREVTTLAAQCLSIKGEERPSMTQVADKLKAIRSTWRELVLLKHNETSFGDLLPSMYWTARMMGMDIETPLAN